MTDRRYTVVGSEFKETLERWIADLEHGQDNNALMNLYIELGDQSLSIAKRRAAIIQKMIAKLSKFKIGDVITFDGEVSYQVATIRGEIRMRNGVAEFFPGYMTGHKIKKDGTPALNTVALYRSAEHWRLVK